jgi:hypothetical protein
VVPALFVPVPWNHIYADNSVGILDG